MKKLSFPAEGYTQDANGTWHYIKSEESVVGKLELVWASIQMSSLQDLKEKEHKSNKKLKKAIRLITRFKDADFDSRISLPDSQTLVLEDAEYSLLVRHIKEGNIYSSKVSDDIDVIYEILNSAITFDPSLKLVE